MKVSTVVSIDHTDCCSDRANIGERPQHAFRHRMTLWSIPRIIGVGSRTCAELVLESAAVIDHLDFNPSCSEGRSGGAILRRPSSFDESGRADVNLTPLIRFGIEERPGRSLGGGGVPRAAAVVKLIASDTGLRSGSNHRDGSLSFRGLGIRQFKTDRSPASRNRASLSRHLGDPSVLEATDRTLFGQLFLLDSV